MSAKSNATPWVVGTALIAVVILALTWFFAVSPTLDAVSESRTQTEDEIARADLLEIQVAQLAKQFAEIDSLKGDLAALREQVPSDAALPEFTRELQDLATSAGVTVSTLSPSTPVPFAPAAAVDAVVDAAADAEVSEDGAVDAASADAVAEAAGAVSAAAGVYVVPLTITTVGTYDASMAFVDAIQTTSSRLVLVGGVNALSQTDQGAAGGRPATARGDLEMTLTAYVYLLPDPSVVPAEVDSSTLQVPSGQGNPFAPLN